MKYKLPNRSKWAVVKTESRAEKFWLSCIWWGEIKFSVQYGPKTLQKVNSRLKIYISYFFLIFWKSLRKWTMEDGAVGPPEDVRLKKLICIIVKEQIKPLFGPKDEWKKRGSPIPGFQRRVMGPKDSLRGPWGRYWSSPALKNNTSIIFISFLQQYKVTVCVCV